MKHTNYSQYICCFMYSDELPTIIDNEEDTETLNVEDVIILNVDDTG